MAMVRFPAPHPPCILTEVLNRRLMVITGALTLLVAVAFW